MDSTFHMSPQQFREEAKRLIDWIAGYYEQIERYPVQAQVAPGAVRAGLPASPPVRPEPFDAVMRDLEQKIIPGITHWQSPNFYAYFPGNSSGPSVLGELLSAAFGVQGMLWVTGPACTELEAHVLDWLVGMLGLPQQFLSSSAGGGVIQDSASSSSLCAILAARERATDFASNTQGCRQPLVAYTSSQAHSSIEKDIKIAGIGSQNLRLIEVDSKFAMRPELLEKAIEADKRNGLQPFFVCATVGTTSTMAFDPLPEIGAICRKHGLWLHVDAAMAGPAALCPEFRYIHNGMELADSYVFDAHKWMFTNFDCSCFYVADRKALINSLSVVPEYLRTQASSTGEVTDYRDWQVPLGRRFRALKLWFVIRHYGVEGLQFHIRRHIQCAQTFLGYLKNDPDFEVAAPPQLNLVCFRLKGTDELNQKLMDRLNKSGELYLSHTKLNGKLVLRLCMGQTYTEERHVERAWRAIRREASRLQETKQFSAADRRG
ncbi:MAG TPA: pyridoxal-dependent decarboxylase [Terriglobales bacterium]|nr:pyridoxal-dependent decarboxylase [Terriglobales bacterium]